MIRLNLAQKRYLMEPLLRRSAAKAMGKLKAHWHTLDWEGAHRIVRSLQRRIVVALQANRWGKVKALQWVLTHSFSAKAIAVKRVTQNRGSKTSGIDGQRWDHPIAKYSAIECLKRKSYKAQALRRIKIPKSNGKYRNLGIPTMKDRAMQALYLLGLEPIAETLADHHSYGFRQHRGCHDAIGQCFIVLAQKSAAQWVLEGDIRACFDEISHLWMQQNIPMDQQVLSQWLKTGYVQNKQWYPTEAGTPQGSIISPTLANIVLDGMAKAIDQAMKIQYRQTSRGTQRINNPYQIHFIRYADDFLVVANDKKVLLQEVKPAIESFLKERGLSLSAQKTLITHISKGVDFLGQNIRKYPNGKLIIKPSKKNTKRFLDKVRQTIDQAKSATPLELIKLLNPMIRGWANYHRHICAKKTFNKVDHLIWKAIWRWCCRRHPNKGKKWIYNRYFTTFKGDKWRFATKVEGKSYYLNKAAHIPIQRHTKIRAAANPFDKEEQAYFDQRLMRKMLNKWHNRHQHKTLFKQQEGKCLICNQSITPQTGWHLHHRTQRAKGGNNELHNLVILHPNCHYQVHHLLSKLQGDVSIKDGIEHA